MFQSVLDRLRERQTAELKGEGAAEAGFTLIELMVVLLIIAILLAIAIPTFLGVTSSANDRAAQSNLSNGLTEALAQYQSAAQTYSGVSAALVTAAPEFTWTASTTGCTTTQPNCISVAPVDVAAAGDSQGVILASMSKTGTCWWVAQLEATPTSITETAPPVAFLSATSGHIGYQSFTAPPAAAVQVPAAGTYYAKKAVGSAMGTGKFAGANCNANYPDTETTSATGFN